MVIEQPLFGQHPELEKFKALDVQEQTPYLAVILLYLKANAVTFRTIN